MAKVKKEVKERKVSLQVDVFVKDGVINEVKQSAHLGNQVMVENEDGDTYECVGVYNRADSKVDVSFEVFDLGAVKGKEEVTGGMSEKDVKFNALAWLDEPEKLGALSDAEKAQLQNIGVIELNDLVIGALIAEPRVWDAMADAAMAIMQHARGTDEAFPKPILVHNTQTVVGDHSDDADAVLDVGDYEFTTGDKYWRFCEFKVCDDKRELYRFTWMDVPESFLAEQE